MHSRARAPMCVCTCMHVRVGLTVGLTVRQSTRSFSSKYTQTHTLPVRVRTCSRSHVLRQCLIFLSMSLCLCACAYVLVRTRVLRRCLKAMIEDKDVVIERVKNRMSDQWVSKMSAGYRHVLVNLRIVDEASMVRARPHTHSRTHLLSTTT